jgi:hypothetical protein
MQGKMSIVLLPERDSALVLEQGYRSIFLGLYLLGNFFLLLFFARANRPAAARFSALAIR